MNMYTLPAFLVVISIIVVIHELGHYWMARLFGTKIDAFSIGFGPKLFGWTDRRGTEWKVCLLPLGGFVKFHGDENAASVPDREQLEDIRNQMRAEGQDPHQVFHLKPLYQRALIVFAGPLANFILAIALFAGFFTLVGEPLQKVYIESVQPGSPAEEAGLLADDRITAINGWRVFSVPDLKVQVATAADKPLRFTVERGTDTFDVTIRPERKERTYEDPQGVQRTIREGLIGVSLDGSREEIVIFHHSLGSAVTRGYQRTVFAIDRTFHYLGGVVRGKESADQLGGPLRIAQMSGQVAAIGLVELVVFIAFLSVSVGLVNLFPIPILDGGHLLFYAIEAIQGRPLSHQVQEIGFRIGLAILALFFIFVTWNDIQFLWAGASS